MKKRIKKTLVIAFCFVLFGIASISAYAYSSIPYNTTSKCLVYTACNAGATGSPLSANTRPSSGDGGAIIYITKTNGTTVASKLFPYQTSVSDLKVTVPASQNRQVKVGPYISGQQVKGNVRVEY